MRVRASNAEGAGDWSPAASRRTDAAAEAPDAPSAPTLTAGTTWLEASWTAPADNGAAITGYDVHYRTTGGNWQDANHTGRGTTKRIESLTPDTAYQVRVRASNAEGAGDWSPAASARTDPSAEEPDAPAAPTLTAGTTWLDASWTAPADNGAAITDYDVHYRQTGGNWQDANHDGTGTTKRIESLTPDTEYDVRVRASNAEGAGDWSPAASGRTDATNGAAEGDVRLVGGSTEQEGRVEIHHNGEWGTVCDDRFVSDDAAVVCRQVGYTGGQAHTRAAFGAGTGTIWMDDVRCAGSESRLADCPFAGWGLHNCRHSEDVGVSCGPAAGTSLNSLTLSGTLLTLRFDRPLDSGSVPSPGEFVAEAGGSPIPVASVSVVGDGVLLELSRPARPSENLTFTYLPATMHPLRDTSLNPVPALTAQPVLQVQVMATPDDDTSLDFIAPREMGTGYPRAKVEVLDLSASSRFDLHDLSVLTDLERLDLGGNRVSDISPLLPIAGLEELNLSGNAVSSRPFGPWCTDEPARARPFGQPGLGPLAARLHDPSAPSRSVGQSCRRPAALVRASPPRGAPARRQSDLKPGPVVGLATRNFARLSLRANGVTDAAMLQEMRSLRRLDLSHNLLRDIGVLGDLPNLVFLGLSGNPVTDLSPLGRLTVLRWLTIDQGSSSGGGPAPRSAGERVAPFLIGTTDGRVAGER